jgi:hypothetical protein
MAATKKTYYPPKTFDDDLDGLARLCQSKGWAFSGVDVNQLATEAQAQRAERAEHDALEGRFASVHEAFGLAQAARYQHFSAVLNAARGAFRTDKAVMAELNLFKRSAKKAPAKKSGE